MYNVYIIYTCYLYIETKVEHQVNLFKSSLFRLLEAFYSLWSIREYLICHFEWKSSFVHYFEYDFNMKPCKFTIIF